MQVKLAYFKHRDIPLSTDNEIASLADVIYKDRIGSRQKLRELMAESSHHDEIIVSTIHDLGTLPMIFTIVRRLEKKAVYIISLSEPWFSTYPSSLSRDAIVGLSKVKN